MIALQVSRNGNPLCLAGAEDLSVLNAMIGFTGRLGSSTRPGRDDGPDFQLRVGGLTTRNEKPDEHHTWAELFEFDLGDEITVRLVETDEADLPIRSREKDEERAHQRRREEWEYAKEYYLTFRKEFEPEDL